MPSPPRLHRVTQRLRRAGFWALLAAAMAAPGRDSAPLAQQGFQPSQQIKADTVVDFPVDI